MAETIQEMIARKRREKAEGKTDKPVVDNEAARRGMQTEISTAKRSYETLEKGVSNRDTIDIQDKSTKDVETEKSTGQKLLEDRQKRAKAKAYIEANSK